MIQTYSVYMSVKNKVQKFSYFCPIVSPYEFCVAAGMIIHPGSEDIYSVATIRELKEICIIARDKDKNKRLYDMVNMYNIHQNDVLNDDMRICLKLGIEEGLADG